MIKWMTCWLLYGNMKPERIIRLKCKLFLKENKIFGIVWSFLLVFVPLTVPLKYNTIPLVLLLVLYRFTLKGMQHFSPVTCFTCPMPDLNLDYYYYYYCLSFYYYCRLCYNYYYNCNFYYYYYYYYFFFYYYYYYHFYTQLYKQNIKDTEMLDLGLSLSFVIKEITCVLHFSHVSAYSSRDGFGHHCTHDIVEGQSSNRSQCCSAV